MHILPHLNEKFVRKDENMHDWTATQPRRLIAWSCCNDSPGCGSHGPDGVALSGSFAGRGREWNKRKPSKHCCFKGYSCGLNRIRNYDLPGMNRGKCDADKRSRWNSIYASACNAKRSGNGQFGRR